MKFRQINLEKSLKSNKVYKCHFNTLGSVESAGFWIHTSWSSGAFLCGVLHVFPVFLWFLWVSVCGCLSLWPAHAMCTLARSAQHIKCCVKPSSVKWILKSSNPNAYLLTSLREGAAPGLFLLWRKQSLPKLSFYYFSGKGMFLMETLYMTFYICTFNPQYWIFPSIAWSEWSNAKTHVRELVWRVRSFWN